jgi:hypothetical protein
MVKSSKQCLQMRPVLAKKAKPLHNVYGFVCCRKSRMLAAAAVQA